MPTLKIADLEPRLPREPIIIVDPGKRCGVAVVPPASAIVEPAEWLVDDVELDDLTFWLATACAIYEPAFIACEDYSLTGGNRRNDPKVPSAIGIGMVRAVGVFAERRVVLLPRGVKSAGHATLDPAGRAAFATAKNDHRRDVVDLGGFCLRELRVAEHNTGRVRPAPAYPGCSRPAGEDCSPAVCRTNGRCCKRARRA